jgi:hypothetical protein
MSLDVVNDGDWTWPAQPRDYSIVVDPTHEYEFRFAGWIYAYDAKMATLSAVVTIIPEPTTFTLLGLGSLALVMVRRRK